MMLRLHQFVTATAIVVLSVAPNMVPIPACCASGFPGAGSAADWSDALPHYNLGNKYLNEGRYDDAARKFRDAIEHYRFDPDFYLNLGVASQKLHDYPSAEQAFKQAVQLNDKDWSAWMDLGNAYIKQDKLKEALHTFERALQLNPPAADKKFLQDDISDIHKVLRNLGQEPMPADAPSKKTGQPSSQRAKRSTAGKPLLLSPSGIRGSAAANMNTSDTPAGQKPAPPGPQSKDWGY